MRPHRHADRAQRTKFALIVYARWRTSLRAIVPVNALEAGFDGVEIQAASSHLVDQFLEDVSHLRTDVYGGGIENRVRFLLVYAEEGAGIRLVHFQSTNIGDSFESACPA